MGVAPRRTSRKTRCLNQNAAALAHRWQWTQMGTFELVKLEADPFGVIGGGELREGAAKPRTGARLASMPIRETSTD